MPDAAAVGRHPTWRRAKTSSGVAPPPTAIPNAVSDRARDRRRSNQRTVSVVIVMNPHNPAPTEMRKNEAMNWTSLRTWLNRRKPTHTTAPPTRMTRREPKRVSIHPWIGPSKPLSARLKEYATDIVVLLHP